MSLSTGGTEPACSLLLRVYAAVVAVWRWGHVQLLLQPLAYNPGPQWIRRGQAHRAPIAFVLLTKHRLGAWYMPCFYAGPWCVNIPSSQEENGWAIREAIPGW